MCTYTASTSPTAASSAAGSVTIGSPSASTYARSAGSSARTPASTTWPGFSGRSGTSPAGPSPSSVRSTMPWNAPDGEDSGVLRSPCASNHTTASRSPCRRAAAAIGATSTPQSPPAVSAGRPPVRSSAARTPAALAASASSPGSSATATRAAEPGTRPASSRAPSTNRRAVAALDPRHWGTSTTAMSGNGFPPKAAERSCREYDGVRAPRTPPVPRRAGRPWRSAPPGPRRRSARPAR